ncbi:hypothetical protein PAECIP111802_05911 [Paenibacillus allorhizosphaerae]|uniref:Uncharacterized protein n=1 Tax=Paenibacillus allorhizosphaerae TaxID=2849866 RepID=A0ABM8VR93_9BACL|nr:hypothetical protein PAECIP111802_05911 [Paenibacillus allorhizosphaerae]
MLKARHDHAEYPMVNIAAGHVELRDDRINATWTVELNSFLLAPVPVTNDFYCSILQQTVGRKEHPQAPVHNR